MIWVFHNQKQQLLPLHKVRIGSLLNHLVSCLCDSDTPDEYVHSKYEDDEDSDDEEEAIKRREVGRATKYAF